MKGETTLTLSQLISNLPKLPKWLYDDAMKWCGEKKLWFLRVPVIVFMVYVLFRHMGSSLDQYAYYDIFSAINLPMHEMGHVLFGLTGIEFAAVAGGTMLEWMVPVFVMIAFLKQRDYFGVSFAFSWLASAMYGTAVYMFDARRQALNLVTIGYTGNEPVGHDWYFLFEKTGLIFRNESVALLVHNAAHLLSLIGILAGSYLTYRMKFPIQFDENSSKGKTVKIDF